MTRRPLSSILQASALAAVLAGCADDDDRRPMPFPSEEARQLPANRSLPARTDRRLRLERIGERKKLALADCLALAEEQSERIGTLAEQVKIAEARGDRAVALALPRLVANAQYFRQEKPILGDDQGSSRERVEDWLTVQQPIFNGFRDLNAVRGAKTLTDSARQNRDYALLQVDLAVCDAYASVLSADHQATAIDSSLELARNRLDELKARQENGMARRTEVLLAEAQVARIEAQRTQTEAERTNARALLAFLTGEPVALPLDDFPGLEIPPLDPRWLSDEAMRGRKDLAALKEDEEAARLAIWVDRSGWWPEVNLTGNWYDRRAGTYRDVDWDVSLLAQWALYEGGKTQASVRESEAKRRQAAYSVREKTRQIGRESEESVSLYKSSVATLDSLRKEVKAAEETQRLLQEEFRHGIATHIELLTAQDTLLAARVSLARQELSERISVLRLWAVTGRMPALKEAKKEEVK